MEQVTVTLPISQTAGWVILTALGIAAATVLVWLTLEESRRDRPRGPLALLTAFGWAMVPIWLLIFAGTLWQLWAMLTGSASSLTGGGLGAGALIAAVLGAPFVIWGTVLKQRTVDFQKEGHITDRITSAVEQLGAEKTVECRGRGLSYKIGAEHHNVYEYDDEPFTYPANATDIEKGEWEPAKRTKANIEVRIGAILSLERIAQDSTRYDKGRDHVRVMEILCAYIRENSNATPPVDFPEPEWEPLKDNPTEEERAAHLKKRRDRFGGFSGSSKAYKWTQSLPEPRADIAQAFLVLGRRTADQRKVEAAWPDPPDEDTEWVFDRPCPELPEEAVRPPEETKLFKEKLDAWKQTLTDYPGYRLDLRGANLQRADLSATRPDRSGAVFSGARLQGARMEGANLTNARMEGATLWFVWMAGTELIGVSMEAADLKYGHMEGANGVGSRMEGASLSGARIQGADFSSARMERANLSEARMEGAELGFARMQGANLSEARMDKTTDWTGVSLSGANVRSVDFRETTISEEQIKTAFGDGSTKLPEDFQRPAHWPEAGLDWRNFHTEYQEWLQNPGAYTPPAPEQYEGQAADDEETPEPPA